MFTKHHLGLACMGLLSTSLLLAGCGDDDDDSSSGGSAGAGGMGMGGSGGGGGGGDSIVGIAAADPNFSTLVAAVQKAGLADALEADGLTVFAPTNDAFAALLTAIGASSLDDLSAEQLTPILLYHVVGAEVDSTAASAAASGDGTVAALGGTIRIAASGGGLVLDGNASITMADIQASNGYIHVIDSVLLPSITDVVTTSDSLSTLATALVAADGDPSMPDLVGTFDGPGSFTLFAPENDAFAAVLSGNGLSDLNALVGALGGTSGLIGILQYHAAGSRLTSADVVAADGTSVDTLNGSVTITVDGGSVIVNQGVDSGFAATNDATVKTVDLYTENGVIHVLDAVIAPPAGG